jgi:serine/threonine protein kinase
MPLSAGDKRGPYEILAPIGAGGMGEVWKARDTRIDRIVAIKVSQEHFSEGFTREARAVAALDHRTSTTSSWNFSKAPTRKPSPRPVLACTAPKNTGSRPLRVFEGPPIGKASGLRTTSCF